VQEHTWNASRTNDLALDNAAKAAAEAVRRCKNQPLERFLNRLLDYLMDDSQPHPPAQLER
jgi:hypothetical protein